MKLTPLREMPAELVLFNQERYKAELAQGIFELMELHNINQTQLSELLGVNKSRVSHILSGDDDNLEAKTVANIFLVLGRAAHLTLGTDLDAIRFLNDEGKMAGTAELNTIETDYGKAHTHKIADYRSVGSTQATGRAGYQHGTSYRAVRRGTGTPAGRHADDRPVVLSTDPKFTGQYTV